MNISIAMYLIDKKEWRNHLLKKALILKNEGGDVTHILGKINSNMINDFPAIQSELDALELLSRIHPLLNNYRNEIFGDHYFEKDNIVYEVKKATVSSKVGIKILNVASSVSHKYSKHGYYNQVTYADSPLVFSKKIKSGNVKSVLESLIATYPFEREIALKVENDIRLKSRKLKKKEFFGTKVAIIDIRSLPIRPDYLMSRINTFFKDRPIELDGALLLVYDYNKELTNGFLIIPNKKSSSPISFEDYDELAAKYPINSEWIYTNPMRFRISRPDVYSLLHREKDGTFYVLGEEIGESLVKDDTIMVPGLIGKPKGMKWLEVSIDDKKGNKFFFD